jgi:hypothetical protein
MSGTKMLAIKIIVIPVFILVMFPIVLTAWMCWYLFIKKTPERRSSRSRDVVPNDEDIIVTHAIETNVILL